MGILVELGALRSRAARVLATKASPGGIRRVAVSALEQTDGGVPGNPVANVFNALKSFGNSIVGAVFALVKNFAISFKAIAEFVVRAVGFVWNFNWNVTDAALDAQLISTYTAFAGAAGGAFGYTMGTLFCGVLPAALVATFNEALALQILLDLGEEILEEVVDKFADLLKVTAKAIAQTAAIFMFKNIRSILRPSSATYRAKLIASGKLNQEQIDAAIAERDKPWSFAIITNDFVESITGSEIIQEAIEEALDEFADACAENIYVIANSLDTAFPNMFTGLNAALGLNTTVSVTPIR